MVLVGCSSSPPPTGAEQCADMATIFKNLSMTTSVLGAGSPGVAKTDVKASFSRVAIRQLSLVVFGMLRSESPPLKVNTVSSVSPFLGLSDEDY